MAEKQGFLRRIFSFGSASEAARTPEHGETPRPNDLEAGRPNAPDPDVRPVAAANVATDAEAGAQASADNGGGITPLSTASAVDGGGTAQKKTASRSSWS